MRGAWVARLFRAALCLSLVEPSLASRASADDWVYNCQVKVGLAHDSGHVKGTVNVESFASCQGNLPEGVTVSAQLQLINVSTGEVVGSDSDSAFVEMGDRNVLVANAASDSCEPGQYQGLAHFSTSRPHRR